MAAGMDLHAEPPPTPSAEMTIMVGPAQSWRAAVPGDQAHHLITTFGILGSACGGISGAVLTLRNPNLTVLALAELGLALVAALLITACSIARARQEERGRQDERARRLELARRAEQAPEELGGRGAPRRKRSR